MPTKFVAQSTKSKRDVIDRDIQHHIPDAAYLIYSDGCRNSAYRSVASQQPFRDSNDNLVVKFNFKAFMFQDMTDGDTIRITAKVVACVDKIDCEPVSCARLLIIDYCMCIITLVANYCLHLIIYV